MLKYKDDILTIKDDSGPVGDSMQILMERLKALGIEEPTEEQKQEQKTLIEEEKASAPKRKWKDMNLLAKELGGVVV